MVDQASQERTAGRSTALDPLGQLFVAAPKLRDERSASASKPVISPIRRKVSSPSSTVLNDVKVYTL